MLQGLIVSSRKESLQHFKKPWAHDHEPVKGLLDAVKVWHFSYVNSYYVLPSNHFPDILPYLLIY